VDGTGSGPSSVAGSGINPYSANVENMMSS